MRPTDLFLPTFNFRITLLRSTNQEAGASRLQPPSTAFSGDALGDGGFQECGGLEVSMDVQEYVEGGRNDGVIKRVGRAKYSPLELKRGMFYSEAGVLNRDLWKWFQDVVSGVRPVPRYDGIVEVMSANGDVTATWSFFRGLPERIAGPRLNGKTGEIAIEELRIAHEGLRLEV